MHRNIWQDRKKRSQEDEKLQAIHGRILNRHLRGRPKNTAWQRIKRSAARLIGPLVILAIIGAVIFAAKILGVL